MIEKLPQKHITTKKPVYQCYRISDGKPILTHFNGKTGFENLDELLQLISVYFDTEQHDFVITTKINLDK